MTSRKLPLTLMLMIVIVSAGSLIQLKPVSATFPGANGKIVFDRNIGTTATQIEIFTVNPDGSGLTQLTFTGAGVINSQPRWSADGTKIAFTSDRTGSSAIWVMNADGSGQTQITFNPNTVINEDPAFSPDGSKIVFQSIQPSALFFSIWVMNVDGTGQKQLTVGSDRGGIGDQTPVWSPDGLKIVFTSGQYHIFVMNPDGSGQTDISKDPNAQDYNPEWSPDGRMIAFDSLTSSSVAIWVMNAADGSGRKQLSNPLNGLEDVYPAWSPDGTKIAYTRLSAAGSIIVMNAADGSNPTDITQSQPNSITDEQPNWQPLSPPPPIIPEYPLGLPLLAIFMIISYGLIRRRTRNTKSI